MVTPGAGSIGSATIATFARRSVEATEEDREDHDGWKRPPDSSTLTDVASTLTECTYDAAGAR